MRADRAGKPTGAPLLRYPLKQDDQRVRKTRFVDRIPISYVLRNQGVHPAPGPWVDNVYLSLDDRWDPADVLLGGSSQRDVLLPGDSRTNLVSGPAPGVLPGSYRILVRSDAAGAIHESNETNNLTASLHSVLAGVTELVPDLATREQIHDGGFLYYRVRTPADSSLVLELSCQEPSAALGLYVRYEGIPSRMEQDFLPFDPPGPRQRVVVPRTRAGDYYILVLGDHVPSPLHADIALTATLPRFQALAGSPDRGGNAGDLTLRVDGVGFDRTCLARLVGGVGPDLVAREHYYETGSRLYATFDLRGLPPGPRSVEVRNREGLATRLSAPLEIVAAGDPPPVVPTITAPKAVGRSRPYSFVVQWSNPSLNDAPAPLLVVGNTVPFGLAPGDESLGTRFTFLGVNTQGGPAGILRPGHTESLRFHAFSGTEEGGYYCYVESALHDAKSDWDWTATLANLGPAGTSADEGRQIADAFARQYGSNAAGYHAMICEEATVTWDEPRLEVPLVHAAVMRQRSRAGDGLWGIVVEEGDIVESWRVAAVNRSTGEERFANTDRRGQFGFYGLPRGQYELKAESPDKRFGGSALVEVPGNGRLVPVQVPARRRTLVSLRIQWVPGEPVQSSPIGLLREGRIVQDSITDEAGVAHFGDVELGVYSLIIATPEGPTRRVDGVRIDPAMGSEIQISVGGAEVQGLLPSGVEVFPALAPQDSLEELVHAETIRGAFRVRVPAGDYRLLVFDSGGELLSSRDLPRLELGSKLDLGATLENISQERAASVRVTTARGPSPRVQNIVWFDDSTVKDWITNLPPDSRAMAKINRLNGDPDKVKEKLVEDLLWGVKLRRGDEYRGVVSDFLSDQGVKRRTFTDASETVKERRGDNPGFRHHKTTEAWLNRLMEEIRKACLANGGPDLSVLQCGDSEVIKLTEIFRDLGRRSTSKYEPCDRSNWARFQSGWMDEECKTLSFDNTLAGGVGWYGTPPEASLFADQRSVEAGTVRFSRDYRGSYWLELLSTTLRVHDAFDFLPGDLGGDVDTDKVGGSVSIGGIVKYATTILAFLEINGRASDVVFDAIWSDSGVDAKERPRKLLIKQGNSPCDPCGLGATGAPSVSSGTQSGTAALSEPAGGAVIGSVGFKETRRLKNRICGLVGRPTSNDPNDIVGPKGAGAEAWVSATETLAYTIRFENDATKALAPAQEVRIVQSLSTNLDWRSFRLGEIVFGTNRISIPAGRTHHRERVDRTATDGVWVDVSADLDLARGEARWELRAVDPETGEVPFDPYVGFLPPNRDGVAGQGFVSYTVRPREGVEEGATIPAEARIVFDYNLPLDTPRIVNSVDTGLPSSTMVPLMATTPDEVFEIRWRAVDGSGGSGIEGVDVYVSEDDGPWKRWVENASSWALPFVGECGRSYAFGSVARDRVGHLEAAGPSIQARTRLATNRRPVLDPVGDVVRAVGQRLRLTNVVHEPDAGQRTTFSLAEGAPAGMAVDPESGILTWRPGCGQGGQRHPVTVLATDDGCGRMQAAQSFHVTVTDCLQAGLGRATMASGEPACLPLSVESSAGLTYLSLLVELPADQLEEVRVEAAAPEVGAATLEAIGGNEFLVTLVSAPGTEMRGPGVLARVCFRLRSGAPSGFLAAGIRDLLGFRPDGEPRGNTTGQSGRVVAVGDNPLLEMIHATGADSRLILYGQPGVPYEIETRGAAEPAGPWLRWRSIVPADLATPTSVAPDGPAAFFRARRAR